MKCGLVIWLVLELMLRPFNDEETHQKKNKKNKNLKFYFSSFKKFFFKN
jgi:hypothetical protein